MARAKIVTDGEGRFYGIRFNCPGCALRGGSGAHILPVNWTPPGQERSPNIAERPIWSFNGDLERPVFGPSVLSRAGHFATGIPADQCEFCKEDKEDGEDTLCMICHSFIGCNGAAPGQIVFLSDCTHAYAGQTMELPELA